MPQHSRVAPSWNSHSSHCCSWSPWSISW
ncbi:hypothetical protein [Arthrobacter sp. EpRS71]